MRSDGSSSSRNNSAGGESVVVDWGRHKSSCGYCKSSVPTSISHGSSRLISYFSSIFFIILLNYYTIFFLTDCFVYVRTFWIISSFLVSSDWTICVNFIEFRVVFRVYCYNYDYYEEICESQWGFVCAIVLVS